MLIENYKLKHVLFFIFFVQIWGLIECKGSVNRTSLYKGLALVAFAQNGKNISEKLLENFAGQGMHLCM